MADPLPRRLRGVLLVVALLAVWVPNRAPPAGAAPATAAPATAEPGVTAPATAAPGTAAPPAAVSPSAVPLAGEQPEVTAAGAVLYAPAEDRVLYGKDEQTPRRIASLSKVMTALLALEAGTLDQTVTVSGEAVARGAEPGAATLNLDEGQAIVMENVLAGLILRSGNDAAVAVAEHVAGSEAAFVDRMNVRADELGLAATDFVDASGLSDEPANTSSPLDLARLGALAMSNADFAAWAGAPTMTIPGLGTVRNRNELAGSYEGVTGIKTGYTSLAGLCLIASATRGDQTLVAVVLDSENSFADAARLLDHGFDDHRRLTVAGPQAPPPAFRWSDLAVDVIPADPVAVTVPLDAAVTQRSVLQPVVDRPAPGGTVVGRSELVIGDQVVAAADLKLAAEVAEPPPWTDTALAGDSVEDALRAFARLEPVETVP